MYSASHCSYAVDISLNISMTFEMVFSNGVVSTVISNLPLFDDENVLFTSSGTFLGLMID